VLAARLSAPSAPWLSPGYSSMPLTGWWRPRQGNERSRRRLSVATQQAMGAGPMIEGQLLQAWARAYVRRSDWANAEKKKYFQPIHNAERQTGRRRNSEWRRTYLSGGDVPAAWEIWTRAEEYGRQALDIRQKLAPGSLEVAASLNNLGMSLATRKSGEGESTTVKPWRSNRNWYQEAFLLQALSQSGDCSLATRRSDKGRGVLPSKALEIKQKLVPGSLTVANTLNNLGSETWKHGRVGQRRRSTIAKLSISNRNSRREALMLPVVSVILGL